jgi:hypothetical protein
MTPGIDRVPCLPGLEPRWSCASGQQNREKGVLLSIPPKPANLPQAAGAVLLFLALVWIGRILVSVL